MRSDECVQAVEKWLEETVIGLNLCPFARKPYIESKVRIVVEESGDHETFFMNLIAELQMLIQAGTEEVETTVIVTPNLFADFDEYLDALAIANELLERSGFNGLVQIASFHPKYQFENVEECATSNFTNRSPVPLFHLIREASLTEMLARYPDTDAIPRRNIEVMEAFSEEELRARFPWGFSDK